MRLDTSDPDDRSVGRARLRPERASRHGDRRRRPRGAGPGAGDARVSGRAAGRDPHLHAGAGAAASAGRAPTGRRSANSCCPTSAAGPEVGRITGRGNTANLEVVLALKPDLILDVGSVSATYVSLAERVQQQTGIPYALLDGRFAGIRRATARSAP